MKLRSAPKFLMNRINGEYANVPIAFDKHEVPTEWPVVKRLFDYYGLEIRRKIHLRFGTLYYDWKAHGAKWWDAYDTSFHELLFGNGCSLSLNECIKVFAKTSKAYKKIANKLIDFNSLEELDIKLAAIGK